MKKYIFSYTRPGHINRKYIIISAPNLSNALDVKPKRIGKWFFSRYENEFKNFHPSTDNKNDIVSNYLKYSFKEK